MSYNPPPAAIEPGIFILQTLQAAGGPGLAKAELVVRILYCLDSYFFRTCQFAMLLHFTTNRNKHTFLGSEPLFQLWVGSTGTEFGNTEVEQ